jgi:hypothetical protein
MVERNGQERSFYLTLSQIHRLINRLKYVISFSPINAFYPPFFIYFCLDLVCEAGYWVIKSFECQN